MTLERLPLFNDATLTFPDDVTEAQIIAAVNEAKVLLYCCNIFQRKTSAGFDIHFSASPKQECHFYVPKWEKYGYGGNFSTRGNEE